MKHGDFTELAKHYVNRPGYSETVLEVIKSYVSEMSGNPDIIIADVGAGTGKLTECLIKIGLKGVAVEPNDAMREEGIKYLSAINDGEGFTWQKGTAEETGLESGKFDWVLMGSSFHWTRAGDALAEFHRILKRNGIFTAIYNPRDVDNSELNSSIERKIKEIVPELNRVSSGSKDNMRDMESMILGSPYYDNLFFMEASHTEVMTRERYLGVWLSVNDIQVQAGEKRWEQIIEMIRQEISSTVKIEIPYKTRAWTVRRER